MLQPKPLILVVCEGSKTECLYLDDIRIKKRINKTRIRIEAGSNVDGNDPRSVVKGAKKLRDKNKRDGLIYDEVWCVFDRDEHALFAQAVDEANRSEIELAVSVPCFELWFLLHFEDQTAHIERDAVISKLRSRIPDYEKSKTGYYACLAAGQGDAMRRAQKLRERHTANGDPQDNNPSTTVDKLTRQLENLC